MVEHYSVEMKLDVKVPMRDGVDLSADIYLPISTGPWPAILMRTPYSNNVDVMIERGRMLANSGYAVVIQDVRGRWDSDGVYYAFHQEVEDGFDTQEWVSNQPWCNGKVGMVGCSYFGMSQLLAAEHQPEGLAAIFPYDAATDLYRDALYHGEALRWYDHYLKGMDSGVWEGAPINLYIQGEDTWRGENEWPLARTEWRKLSLTGESLTENAGPPGERVYTMTPGTREARRASDRTG